MQPILNVIFYDYGFVPQGSAHVYGATHYNPDGYYDLGFRVVEDQSKTWNSRRTRDGKALGLLTAYCTWPYKVQTPCDPSINGTGEYGLGGSDPFSNSYGWEIGLP